MKVEQETSVVVRLAEKEVRELFQEIEDLLTQNMIDFLPPSFDEIYAHFATIIDSWG